MLIALVNLSKLVKSTEAVQIAAAVTAQLQGEYRAIWAKSSTVVAVPDITHIPQGARPMFLLDQADEPGALGDHEESAQGIPMARIFVKEILGAPGAGVLNGNSGFSVSSVVSHEALEMDGNPYTNLWATGPDGLDHAREMSDAVESSCYQKAIGRGVSVLVSNFLTPRWFDAHAPAGSQYDYLAHLKAPFTIERAGYEIVKPSGHETARYGMTASQGPAGARYHFGAEMPQWRRDFKMRHSGRGMGMVARSIAAAPSSATVPSGLHVCEGECCKQHGEGSGPTSAVCQ
jgi:hypothetical protein